MKRTMLPFLLSMSICVPALAHAQTHTPVIIYDNSLVSGWNDWSFGADRDLTSMKMPHEGKGAIAVTSKAWGTLGLHSDGISTADMTTISFWINGGETGGQQLKLTLNGQPGIPSAQKLPTLSKGWQHIEFPLSKLGVAANAPLTLIWLQNVTNDPATTYYIDDIKLM